jgi:hypothetical protein
MWQYYKPILFDQGNSVILSHGGHLIQSNLSCVTKGTVQYCDIVEDRFDCIKLPPCDNITLFTWSHKMGLTVLSDHHVTILHCHMVVIQYSQTYLTWPRQQCNIVTWWSLNTVKPILCDQGNSVILWHGGHLIHSNLSYVTKRTV